MYMEMLEFFQEPFRNNNENAKAQSMAAGQEPRHFNRPARNSCILIPRSSLNERA